METHIHATMARINELQARLGMMKPAMRDERPTPNAIDQRTPIPNTQYQTPASPTQAPAALFDVVLAKANGSIGLRPMAGGAGPFAPNIEALVIRHAAQNGLDPNLVRAVVQQESGGNTRSVSVAGARGLMQLMPETAAMYGVKDSFDPEQNIAAGTRHLAGLMREFNGDVSRALAAYNAGSGAVRKYGGVPPYAETQQYVQRIMGMLGR
jgi:soluble lytic murein transglycosylase-like protein